MKNLSQKQNEKSRKITEIRTWRKDSDFRVYVTFEDCKTQGCYYKNGNAYNKKGSLVDMTNDEKLSALAICTKKLNGQQAWTTVYSNEINPVPAQTIKKTQTTKNIYKPLYVHDKYGTLIELD